MGNPGEAAVPVGNRHLFNALYLVVEATAYSWITKTRLGAMYNGNEGFVTEMSGEARGDLPESFTWRNFTGTGDAKETRRAERQLHAGKRTAISPSSWTWRRCPGRRRRRQ